jgi:hypothetical protein
MAVIYKIPLTNTPQSFELRLPLKTRTFADKKFIDVVFRYKWFDEMKAWAFSIITIGVGLNFPLIINMPLVSGQDLLEQYQYVGIDGQMIVFTSGAEGEPPTLENLGAESNLYFISG